MTAQTFAADKDGITVETVDTETVVVAGPIGKVINVIKNNPFRSLLAVGAAAGAGYLAYDYARDGKTAEAVEVAKEASGIIAEFMA